MKKNNYSANLATINLTAIKAEKAVVKESLDHIKAQLDKNPRYINLCSARKANLESKMELLNKEAKATRRYIRKANRLQAAC